MCHGVTASDTMMQLSPELVHYIGTFCVPSSLAALACANSFLQWHAETVLYQKVSDGFWSNNRCIRSLCSNATRASFVRSLTFVLPDLRFHETLDSLASALVQMPSLLDLRVKAPGGHHAPAKKVLDRILTRSCFQLQTLYCDHSLDTAAIIKYHSGLQILGLYTYGCGGEQLLKHFGRMGQEVQSQLPRIFTLERKGLLPNLNRLSVFPALYPGPGDIFREIAKSLDQDIGSYYTTNSADIRYVSIFLENISDAILISDLLNNINKLSKVTWLDISAVQQPLQDIMRPGGEFTKAISVMTSLKRLKLHAWSIGGDMRTFQGPLENVKFKLLEEWSAACPGLLHVTFMDSKAFTRDGPESAWALRR